MDGNADIICLCTMGKIDMILLKQWNLYPGRCALSRMWKNSFYNDICVLLESDRMQIIYKLCPKDSLSFGNDVKGLYHI